MLPVQAGVNDGNPHTGAGVARLPGQIGLGHLGRHGHVGHIRSAVVGLLRLVPSLQNDLLNAGNLLDGSDIAISHIGRNGVGCQGQIPDNIQLLSQGALDGGRHLILRILQIRPVSHRRIILCNVLGGEASIQGRRIFQENGHTNHIRGFVVRFVGLRFSSLGQKATGNGAVIRLLKANAACLTGCADRNGETSQKRNHQQQG